MIAGLEDYLAAAVQGEAPYVFDAVRTLVKLYQMFSGLDKTTADKIGQCCCLAFLHGADAADTDLLALQYMIPNAILKEQQEPVHTVLQCAAAATACNFPLFWKTYDGLLNYTTDPVIASMATQQVKARQHVILGHLALSYQQAPTAMVLKAVNLDTVQQINELQCPMVSAVTADTITFVSTPDNTQRQRVFVEGASFATVSSLLSKMAQ